MRPGTILEREGKVAQYIYLIMKGEILVYKKVPSLYELETTKFKQENRKTKTLETKVIEKNKLVTIEGKNYLDKFVNPKDGGNSQVGTLLGSIKGPYVLANEDASLLKKPCNYTLVAGENTIVLKFLVKSAFNVWPPETIRILN